MTNVKNPNVKALLGYKCPFVPAYGVIIYPDELNQIDEKSKLFVSFDSNVRPTAGCFRGVSGVVVAIAEEFKTEFTGGVLPKIGDRILTNSNKTSVISDNKINLLVVREPDILALIPPDVKISL